MFAEIGVIYRCGIHNEKCEIFDIDTSGNGQDPKNRQNYENKLSSWLGASMDGNERDDLFVVRFILNSFFLVSRLLSDVCLGVCTIYKIQTAI